MEPDGNQQVPMIHWKNSTAMSLSSNHDPVTQDTPRTTVFPSKLNRRKRVSTRGKYLTKTAYGIPQTRRTLNLAIFTTLIRYSYKLRSIYLLNICPSLYKKAVKQYEIVLYLSFIGLFSLT